MENFRDFLGKDLDACINEAMEYYGCGRANLEIEIIQDAKSGIFGIVGARKAKIRARRAHVREKVASMLNAQEDLALAPEQPRNHKAEPLEVAKPRQTVPYAPKDANSRKRQAKQTAPEKISSESGIKDKKGDGLDKTAVGEISAQPRSVSGPARADRPKVQERDGEPTPSQRKVSEKKPRKARDGHTTASPSDTNSSATAEPSDSQQAGRTGKLRIATDEGVVGDESYGDELETVSWPCRPLSELDGDLLQNSALEIVETILTPIAGRDLQMNLELSPRSVRIHVAWEGDAGLLIGRDGQTLAAVQYVASRILSRIMKSVVRVQLDIGDYRSRQEDRLCELARSLAEKALQTGRPVSTSTLSAYHRRLVHLCLQENEDVQTRSIGEGPLKRVLITPKRTCQQ